MMNVIKFFDFYNSNVFLTFKNEEKFKTKFGGILSILNIFIIFPFFIILGKNMIQKENFSIEYSSTANPKSSFDFSNFPLMITLFDHKGPIKLDEKFFNIELGLVTGKKSENGEFELYDKDIEYISCQELKGNSTYFINNTFSSNDFSNYICLKPGQNVTLYGKYGDILNGFQVLRIYLNKCINKTKNFKTNINCSSSDEIDKKLKDLKIVINFLGYNINNYDTKGNNLICQEISMIKLLSENIQKAFFFSFSKGKYNSDESIFFAKTKRTEFFVFSHENLDIDLNNYKQENPKKVGDNTIVILTFNMDGTEIEYIKNYEKITSFLGEIGGIYNALFFISNFINGLISYKIKLFELIDNLTEQYNLRDNSFNIKAYKRNNFEIINNNSENISKIVKNKEYKNENIINKSNEYLIKKERKISVSSYRKKPVLKRNNNIRIYHHFNLFRNNKNILIKNMKFFYMCPIFVLKSKQKFSYFKKLYQFISNNLSVETIFSISSAWNLGYFTHLIEKREMEGVTDENFKNENFNNLNKEKELIYINKLSRENNIISSIGSNS